MLSAEVGFFFLAYDKEVGSCCCRLEGGDALKAKTPTNSHCRAQPVGCLGSSCLFASSGSCLFESENGREKQLCLSGGRRRANEKTRQSNVTCCGRRWWTTAFVFGFGDFSKKHSQGRQPTASSPVESRKGCSRPCRRKPFSLSGHRENEFCAAVSVWKDRCTLCTSSTWKPRSVCTARATCDSFLPSCAAEAPAIAWVSFEGSRSLSDSETEAAGATPKTVGDS